MSNKPDIVFIASHKMAMPVLQALLQQNCVAGVVVTEQYPEHFQQYQLLAQQQAVPFLALKKKDFRQHLGDFLTVIQPALALVFTFSWRIPAHILSIPTLGFVNIHPGPLPQMRGADPIFQTIWQGRETATITLHKMDEHFDTGDIVKEESFPMHPDITYGMLCRQMGFAAQKLVMQLVADMKGSKEIAGKKQQLAEASYYPKLNAASIFINWQHSTSHEINRLVKACNPVIKGVPTELNGWIIGVTEVVIVNLEGDTSQLTPGTIITIDAQNGLLVYCKDGKAIKLEVIYTEDGVFPGYKLAFFGITTGIKFGLHPSFGKMDVAYYQLDT